METGPRTELNKYLKYSKKFFWIESSAFIFHLNEKLIQEEYLL